MKISTRASRIEPFYVMEVAKAAQAMAREVAGTREPMIFLNIGEPDFTAPPLVQEAAARAILHGATQYTQALGSTPCASASATGTSSALASTCRRGASWSRPAPRPRCSWPAWR